MKDAFRAEWTKLCTLASTLWLLQRAEKIRVRGLRRFGFEGESGLGEESSDELSDCYEGRLRTFLNAHPDRRRWSSGPGARTQVTHPRALNAARGAG
jgi:hypothetical protein